MHTLRNTPGTQAILSKATVGIAGIGGLGSNVAVHLARCGIGRLILADFDVVEISNLNRQHYDRRHIGMKKTDAIKDVLQHINPDLELVTHDAYLDRTNIKTIFEGVDVMVEAFDLAENKSMLMDEWLENLGKMPLVTASGMAGLGPANDIRTRKMGEQLYVVGDLCTESTVGNGLMAPRVILAAAHQSHAVLRILLDQREV